MNNFFDRQVAGMPDGEADKKYPVEFATDEQPDIDPDPAPDPAPDSDVSSHYTPRITRQTAQHLLKFGLLESHQKGNLYQHAITHMEAINRLLEPFDLKMRVDTIRGLAFLVVSDYEAAEDDSGDDWSHPLVRRQRLNLEQSLLVAVLRQQYVIYEQEAGVGAGGLRLEVDEIQQQLQVFLGDSGSDSSNERKVRTLLDQLKVHGIVSEIDKNDEVRVRPIITHLANPETLQLLLDQFKSMPKTRTMTERDERDE